MLIVLHLAAKNTAFSTILPCVLHQNALHLAPKRTSFCSKTHRNNRQKSIIPYTNAWQLHRKHVRLRPPVWGVAGHAAHGLRKQHHEKAEVRWSWPPVFCLWKTVMNNYFLISFLRNNHFWTQANGTEFQISSYLSQVLCTWATCFSWFCSTNII